MIKYVEDELLLNICEELGFNFDNSKDNDLEMKNIIYSVAGKMAIASLWNFENLSNKVSKTSFKNMIKDTIDIYVKIFPSSEGLTSIKDNIVDNIYDIYLSTGHMYTCAYNLAPTISKTANILNIEFRRGFLINENVFMSGLGYFKQLDEEKNSNISIEEMFNLCNVKLERLYTDLQEELKKSDHINISEQELYNQGKFLNHKQDGHNWITDPYLDGTISMLELKGNYYVYQYIDEKFLMKKIPDTYLYSISGKDPNKVAAAILFKYKSLPTINIEVLDDYVIIDYPKILPFAEKQFLLLYSWPYFWTDINSTIRIMDKRVYRAMKFIFEPKGFLFKENI
ncbi:MAG: hypothetical protein Q4P29_06840 [Tissierellia bacterium]|nr:hypothetical protein [Tissierellia bacterium]